VKCKNPGCKNLASKDLFGVSVCTKCFNRSLKGFYEYKNSKGGANDRND